MKLIRCRILNKDNTKSLRYIELDNYKLWAYMMLHKHGLKIKDASLWLWIDEREYERKKNMYSHFPDIEAVAKIELALYDAAHGFSHTISRFVSGAETAVLEKVLLSHISKDLSENENYEMRTFAGYCIKSNANGIKNVILGLSDTDDRIWFRQN